MKIKAIPTLFAYFLAYHLYIIFIFLINKSESKYTKPYIYILHYSYCSVGIGLCIYHPYLVSIVFSMRSLHPFYINEFRCYEAKIEESEKGGSRQESNPGHLWLEPPVLCH